MINTNYTIEPIGVVRSELTRLEEAPMQGDEGAPEAWPTGRHQQTVNRCVRYAIARSSQPCGITSRFGSGSYGSKIAGFPAGGDQRDTHR